MLSMKVPRPDSLVQRTVETIRNSINNGEIGPLLPGEPRLAKTLGVARRTLRNALDILEKDGTITKAKTGCPRKVRKSPPEQKQNTQHKTLITLLPRPVEQLASGTQDFLRELSNNIKSDEVSVTYLHHHIYHLASPDSRLDTITSQSKADVWLLYEASKPIARYFEKKKIPAIICGGPAFKSRLPYLAYDGVATLRHAIGVLTRAGHTRITSPMHYKRKNRIEAFAEELSSRKLPFSANYNTPCWENDPEELYGILHKLLTSKERPTGVIINGMDAVITLYSVLLELNLKIPEDISVVIAGSDPLLPLFHPKLSFYSTDHRSLANALAKMIRQLLKTNTLSSENKLLLMEYFNGKSVAPPPVPK
ncbi:hypothetical protein Rhal01_03588 [Rubritalea halochordaticola]|uniref:HTH gntR-type domain-containing protein n=2 Tax=Rubritalea halochordaticola TaxID=714537 RepID=A0ABP9V677_9BACT